MLSRLRSSTLRAPSPPTESEALASLRALLSAPPALPSPPPPHHADILSDANLLRYLHARDLHPAKAAAMLRASLSWRAAYVPHALYTQHGASLRAEAATGKMFVLPRADRVGRAVVVMRPGLENSTDAEAQVRLLVYTMERAGRVAEGRGTVAVVVDYGKGEVSVANMPGVGVMRKTVWVLQQQYPERLAVCVLWGAPRFVEVGIKMVMPFVDARTKAKVVVVGAAEVAGGGGRQLGGLLAMEDLPKEMGGGLEYVFDVDEYFAEDEARLA